jgi:hypothetical protein
MRFGRTDVACSTQTECAYAKRDTAFNTGPRPIDIPESRFLLPLAQLLQAPVLGFGSHQLQGASLTFGTSFPDWAMSARVLGKTQPHDIVAFSALAKRPDMALLTLRTGRTLRCPIDSELILGVGGRLASLYRVRSVLQAQRHVPLRSATMSCS